MAAPGAIPDDVDTLIPPRSAWHAGAACRSTPGIDFFPSQGPRRRTDAALAVCRGCPVVAECLAYAMADAELVRVGRQHHRRARADASRRCLNRPRQPEQRKAACPRVVRTVSAGGRETLRTDEHHCTVRAQVRLPFRYIGAGQRTGLPSFCSRADGRESGRLRRRRAVEEVHEAVEEAAQGPAEGPGEGPEEVAQQACLGNCGRGRGRRDG